MKTALALLVALIAASPPATAPTPEPRQPITRGKEFDCSEGYDRVRRKLTAQGRYLPIREQTGPLFTTYFEPAKRSLWRMAKQAHPAYPAVVVVRINEQGQSVLRGACGYGDPAAFETFVNAFWSASDRTGR